MAYERISPACRPCPLLRLGSFGLPCLQPRPVHSTSALGLHFTGLHVSGTADPQRF
jgi:hypothetical protein